MSVAKHSPLSGHVLVLGQLHLRGWFRIASQSLNRIHSYLTKKIMMYYKSKMHMAVGQPLIICGWGKVHHNISFLQATVFFETTQAAPCHKVAYGWFQKTLSLTKYRKGAAFCSFTETCSGSRHCGIAELFDIANAKLRSYSINKTLPFFCCPEAAFTRRYPHPRIVFPATIFNVKGNETASAPSWQHDYFIGALLGWVRISTSNSQSEAERLWRPQCFARDVLSPTIELLKLPYEREQLARDLPTLY